MVRWVHLEVWIKSRMSCFCWGCRWTMQSNCSCLNLSLSCAHLTILYESVRQDLFHTTQVKYFTCRITHLPKTDNSKIQLNFLSFYVDEDERECYWMETCIPQSEDPLVWWYGKSKHFPKQCHLENPYFYLPATSVAIDFFSAAGIIVEILHFVCHTIAFTQWKCYCQSATHCSSIWNTIRFLKNFNRRR